MARNRIIPYRRDLREKARRLRSNSTPGERVLWPRISRKQLGHEFHRQVPILDYIVDFYCHELQLAVEIDGRSHGDAEKGIADIARQARLESVGVTIVRYSEEETYRDPSAVAQSIARVAEDLASRGEAGGLGGRE